MFDVHSSMYREYGPIYGMSILGRDTAVVCDPREYERVYHSEGKYPHGSSQEAPVFIEYHESRGNDYVSKSMRDGEDWRNWRQKLNRDIFLKSSARSYTPSIAAAARGGSTFAPQYANRMDNFISRLAFDMFCSIAFGESPGTVDVNAEEEDVLFVKNTQDAFSLAGVIMLSPQEKVLRSSRYDSFVDSMDKSMEFSKERTEYFVQKALDRQREDSNQGEMALKAPAVSADEDKCPFSSVIDRLVARNEMQTDELTETIGSLLMAGVDTTAYVMGWLWINLARSVEAQGQLAAELESVLAGSDVKEEDLDRLPYLRACVRESHRLTPPFPQGHTRRLKNDITIGGYTFPAGMLLSMNINAFQMDEKYVDEPEEYRPERWLPEAVARRKGTEKEVLDHRLLEHPFGAGARMCLGSKLAEIEIIVATARIFQDWKVTLDPPEQKWNKKQLLFVKADPFPKFKLTPRH